MPKLSTRGLFPSAFNDDFRAILKHTYTEYVEAGGRGSCKSSFISLAIVILIVQHRDYNALILRKTASSLRNSVFEQMKWAVDKLNLNQYFRFTVSPMQAIFIPTGQSILFSGVDDPTRLKSLKAKSGYFAITWFEESSEFSPDEQENVKLTTMRGGTDFYVFDSFNPPSASRNWKNTDIRKPKANRLVHLSDYRTTPKAWLGDAFFFEAEEMQKTNERAYRNIFLGEPTGTGANVFENVTLRTITDEEINHFDVISSGMDFGYYPDAFRWIIFSYNHKTKTLYIFGELHLLKHSNFAASEKMKAFCQSHDIDYQTRITADSANPKDIADMREFGWNLRGAIKGKGSLDAGFKWLQSITIICDAERCPFTADELSLYEYEIDKRTGEILEGYPQNQPDHSLAALRYGTEPIWRHKGA